MSGRQKEKRERGWERERGREGINVKTDATMLSSLTPCEGWMFDWHTPWMNITAKQGTPPIRSSTPEGDSSPHYVHHPEHNCLLFRDKIAEDCRRCPVRLCRHVLLGEFEQNGTLESMFLFSLYLCGKFIINFLQGSTTNGSACKHGLCAQGT